MPRCPELMFVALLGACNDAGRAAPNAEPAPPVAAVPAAATSTPDLRRCRPPAGVTGAPTSIADAVTLLGRLPPPVTVACFVESLDRPLHVFASASPFSAQPSTEVASPRIFIRNGPLTMAVIGAGTGRALLEFSEFAGEGRTIKGEVELPHAGALTASAAYDRVQTDGGTTCGACHDDEEPASAARGGFASEVLHPSPEFDVPLAYLRNEAVVCDSATDAERCALLEALFDHGEVLAGTLPGGGRICDH